MTFDYGDKQILIGLRTCAEEGDEDSVRTLRESFETALKDAQTGDAESQYALAMHYDYGFGTEENDELASEWFEKAAMQGHAMAMRRIGGDEWDKKAEAQEKETFKKHEKAAGQGDPDSMYYLASEAYWYGIGAEQDKDKSIEWYHKAAELGQPQAMRFLAAAYKWGIAVEEDETKAAEWEKKAENK